MPPLASAPRPKPKRKVYLNHYGSARKQPRWINRRLTMQRSRRRRRRTRRRRRRRLELQAKPDHCPLPMRICLNVDNNRTYTHTHTHKATPRHPHTHAVLITSSHDSPAHPSTIGTHHVFELFSRSRSQFVRSP